MARIHDELAELEQQLSELETVTEEPQEEETVEEEVAEPVEEDKPAEPEPETKTEEKTASDYQRERKERKSREERLQAEVEELRRLVAEKKEAEEKANTPNRDENYEGWVEHNLGNMQQTLQEMQKERQITAAKQDLANRFAEFKQYAPDFDDVANFANAKLADGLRALHGLNGVALSKAIDDAILEKAVRAVRLGEDPAEYIYNWAKNDLGYKPQPKQEETKEIKPDLDKIARNKQRSAGTAAAQGGAAKGEMTLEYMAGLKPKDVAKLSREDRERYFASR